MWTIIVPILDGQSSSSCAAANGPPIHSMVLEMPESGSLNFSQVNHLPLKSG